MAHFQLLSNLYLFICMAISFSYGVFRFFRKGKALYLQLIICGIGCMMFGRLFRVVRILTGGNLPIGFHVGVLGIMGSFLFFFSANYGQMDSLTDDGSRLNIRYRLLALIAPVIVASGYIYIAFSDTTTENKVVCGTVMIAIMLSAYYSLKHLLFPDIEYGIIRCIRGYNFLVLVLALLCVAEMTLLIVGNWVPLLIVYILMGIVSLLVPPVLEKGVNQWTI